jgi:hypothetical protein
VCDGLLLGDISREKLQRFAIPNPRKRGGPGRESGSERLCFRNETATKLSGGPLGDLLAVRH